MTVPRRPGRMAMRKSRLVRRRIRNTFYTIGFILSSAAISQAGYGFFMEAPYFALKEPQIEGVSDDVRREIIGLISSHVDNQPNLLSINSTELEEQIALHPRVRDIRVTKVYPNSLKISAVEREEMAIAATAAGYFLIDNEGHVMGRLDLEDLLRIDDLPLVSGLSPEAIHEGEKIDSDSLDKTLLLIQVLRQRNKKLYDLISEVQIQQEAVSPLETLVMHMKGGLDILLGDGNPVDKLPELETLLLKLESESVDPYSDLVYIDLSYDKMGFVMEKETALLVKNREYEIVQQALQEANEKYARTHAQQQQQSNNTTQNQGAGQSGQVRRAAPARPAVPAQQQPVQAQYGYGYGNQQAAYPPGYYQQQQPRAAYPQGYYQQSQQQRPQQYPQAQYPRQYQQQAPGSLYNMPRTQQR